MYRRNRSGSFGITFNKTSLFFISLLVFTEIKSAVMLSSTGFLLGGWEEADEKKNDISADNKLGWSASSVQIKSAVLNVVSYLIWFQNYVQPLTLFQLRYSSMCEPKSHTSKSPSNNRICHFLAAIFNVTWMLVDGAFFLFKMCRSDDETMIIIVFLPLQQNRCSAVKKVVSFCV